ncbi:hypothetical protein K9N68_37915 (plasmid) [Kovacikia minuta CCNUW1]|uniref:hypothetical protein n=1 Tax=Kovacikia minuta TaxID=2931930 RepID=UPI001CCAA508|nr:hypothetical protein [Kovacikia minuta]UBF29983.1 hypothetical protein K9N68_37915 [Kovacikia minuta CCNUW1]
MMGHFPLLDIAIGLTLIYTFLSLLVSELTEFMTTLLRWRAHHLQQGIMTLLGESLALRYHPDQFKNTVTGKLYYSSLIASITQRTRQYRRFVGPSYIPSTVFADALLEVLQTLPEVERQQPQLQQGVDQSMSELARLMAKVENSDQLPARLKDNLKRLANRTQMQAKSTELQMEQFRHEIAFWYEHSMERLSGAYRRKVKAFTVLMGSILAILINADSLYMLRRISENTATRSVIVQNAVQIQGCQEDLSSAQCMNKMAKLLDSTTVPIGWHPVNFQQQFPQFNPIVLLKVFLGWLLTGIAISMGSRFWFQILDQLVHVRETGEKPTALEKQ